MRRIRYISVSGRKGTRKTKKALLAPFLYSIKRLKKGGELIISYQLEYYEKNLVSYLVLTAVLFFMVIVYPAIVKK